MTRITRYHPPGALVHMISSFSFGDFAFEISGARAKYLSLVARAASRTDWTLLAFALMGSHPHWALLAGNMKPSSFYHSINTGFGLWVNHQRRSMLPETAARFVGPVFAARPSTFTLAPQDAPRLIPYIHNNPVRAKVVEDAAHSSWTSHRMYLDPTSRPPWLDVGRGLDLCGFSDTAAGRSSFHDLTSSLGTGGSHWIPADAEARNVRRLLRQDMGAPASIANPHAQPGALEWTYPIVWDPSMPIRTKWAGSTTGLLAEVAVATGISMTEIRSRNRNRKICQARRVAIIAWRYFLGRSQKEIAVALGISGSSASNLAKRDQTSSIHINEIARRVAERCWGKLCFDS